MTIVPGTMPCRSSLASHSSYRSRRDSSTGETPSALAHWAPQPQKIGSLHHPARSGTVSGARPCSTRSARCRLMASQGEEAARNTTAGEVHEPRTSVWHS
ncbi:hypothetical protein ACU635_20460 [[Actinomadura] parvosata]|uniref:hypothetical protein n=1 Tax=[Actinomadura] parvosata TaxID=1955412 RepID=UPI00406D03C5